MYIDEIAYTLVDEISYTLENMRLEIKYSKRLCELYILD